MFNSMTITVTGRPLVNVAVSPRNGGKPPPLSGRLHDVDRDKPAARHAFGSPRRFDRSQRLGSQQLDSPHQLAAFLRIIPASAVNNWTARISRRLSSE